MTDYVWYVKDNEDGSEIHVMIFGDADLYNPLNSESDAEFDSEEAAQEWFDNYYGFEEDDEEPSIEESIEETSIEEDPMAKLARKHNLDILSPMGTEPGSMRVSGTVRDLDNFYKEAEELGLLNLEESIKMTRDELIAKEGTDDVDLINAGREEEDRVELTEDMEFNLIAEELGLTSEEDLKLFLNEEVHICESKLDAIKRYKNELIESGIDLSTLKPSPICDVLEESVMSDLDQEIQEAGGRKELFLQLLNSTMLPLKKKIYQLESNLVKAKNDEEQALAKDEIKNINSEIDKLTAKLKLLLK